MTLHRNLILVLVLVLLSAGIAGCNQNLLRDDDDDTGVLGRIDQESPADIYVKLGVAYMQVGQYAVALRKLKQGLEADPNDGQVNNVLGLLYERLGEGRMAEHYYGEAVRLEPENPYIRNAWGTFLCKQEKYPEAEAQFNRALKNPLYQTPWVAMTNAGLCAERAGDPVAAERAFRRALSTSSKFPVALYQMAKLSFEQGNYLSSRAYLQRYLEVAEHTAQSLWLGIRVEDKMGDRNTVAGYILLLKGKFPDAPEVQFLREFENR